MMESINRQGKNQQSPLANHDIFQTNQITEKYIFPKKFFFYCLLTKRRLIWVIIHFFGSLINITELSFLFLFQKDRKLL